jgi:hypothetical protein
MRKYILAAALAILTAGFSAAQEGLTISGEVKTGLYWEKKQRQGEEPETKLTFHNNDDAGSGQGRFRLNLQYEKDNIGMKTRIQWETWTDAAPAWSYAFGYGNFFDNQLTLSLGKLGSSPWGTGGPEMWAELESARYGGVRVEVKPHLVPGLNAGFVLNHYDAYDDAGFDQKDVTLAVILQESVLGVSYDHDLFGVRFAYRLDSEGDRRDRGTSGKEGDSLIYRVEERILKNYLENFQIWANGSYRGVGAESEDCIQFLNWLYAQYAPPAFTAQFRLGYDVIENRSILHVRPSFYYNFFDKLLSVGASVQFAQDFGDGKMYEGSPYLYWSIEPMVKLNLGRAYAAFVYRYTNEYKYHTEPPLEQAQWINLRFGLTF